MHPGGQFTDEASAAFDIALTIGGTVFSSFFLAGLVIAQFASDLAAPAGASRLLFAMRRDGVLPKRVFAAVSARFHTPAVSIAITGLVGLIALFLDVATSASFIDFGAFTAFTMVNVAVVAYFARHRGEQKLNVLLYVVVPVIGAIVSVYLLTQLVDVAEVDQPRRHDKTAPVLSNRGRFVGAVDQRRTS